MGHSEVCLSSSQAHWPMRYCLPTRLQLTKEGGKYFQNYPDAILRRLDLRASGRREYKAANVREGRPSLGWQLAGEEPLIMYTRRYGPLHGPSSSSCGGLQSWAKDCFALQAKKRLLWPILGNFWC